MFGEGVGEFRRLRLGVPICVEGTTDGEVDGGRETICSVDVGATCVGEAVVGVATDSGWAVTPVGVTIITVLEVKSPPGIS